MKKLIKKLEEKTLYFKRIEMLKKEKVVYIPYVIRPIEKKILLRFGKLSSLKLAKELGINRSYIYAVLEKFKNIYTKSEVRNL